MNEINLKEYYYQIWKRRQLVGIFLACVLLLTAVFTWRQPRVYRAVAIIEIGAETPDVMYQDVLNVSSTTRRSTRSSKAAPFCTKWPSAPSTGRWSRG
jgi:uncharacterized protein involved in exopolysaccharide biosynthesis